MPGTQQGSKKAVKTIKERHGKDYFARIGKIGGRNGRTGGTFGNPKRAAKIGSVGGKRSKRGYKLLGEVEGGLEYLHKASGKKVVFKTNQLDR